MGGLGEIFEHILSYLWLLCTPSVYWLHQFAANYDVFLCFWFAQDVEELVSVIHAQDCHPQFRKLLGAINKASFLSTAATAAGRSPAGDGPRAVAQQQKSGSLGSVVAANFLTSMQPHPPKREGGEAPERDASAPVTKVLTGQSIVVLISDNQATQVALQVSVRQVPYFYILFHTSRKMLKLCGPSCAACPVHCASGQGPSAFSHCGPIVSG